MFIDKNFGVYRGRVFGRVKLRVGFVVGVFKMVYDKWRFSLVFFSVGGVDLI